MENIIHYHWWGDNRKEIKEMAARNLRIRALRERLRLKRAIKDDKKGKDTLI